MARPRKYDYDMILQLHHSGMPVEEIASAVKATSKVVYKILSIYHLTANKPRHVIENQQRREAEKQKKIDAEETKKRDFSAAIEAGGTYAQAAKAVGISVRAAAYYGVRSGIRSKARGAAAVLTPKRIQEYCDLCGFKYIGGYAGDGSRIKVSCVWCGAEYEYSIISIRHHSVTCKKCRDAERYVDSLVKAEQRETEKNRREAIRIMDRYSLAEHKKKQMMYQNIFPKWKVESYQCKGCGKSFIPEETGYNSKKYCSATCQNRLYQRKQNQSRDHRKRWRKHDNDISLDALYRRDHGICYLCGKICDYSDMEVVNGVFIAGNTYPSIDHIRPLSRGGTDTWDNIKLAHRLCNSKKGAAYDTDETSLDA